MEKREIALKAIRDVSDRLIHAHASVERLTRERDDLIDIAITFGCAPDEIYKARTWQPPKL